MDINNRILNVGLVSKKINSSHNSLINHVAHDVYGGFNNSVMRRQNLIGVAILGERL